MYKHVRNDVRSYASINDLLPNPAAVYEQRPDSDNELSLDLSITEHGIREPLTVTAVGNKLKIVNGHGRYQSALRLGIPELPIRVVDYRSQADEIMDMIALNNKRNKSYRDYISEYDAYRNVYPKAQGKRTDLLGEDGILSNSEIAKRIGIGYKTLERLMQVYNEQPSLFEKIEDGSISPATAQVVCRVLKCDGYNEAVDVTTLMVRTIALGAPNLLEYVANGSVTMEKAFSTAAKSISSAKSPHHTKVLKAYSGPISESTPVAIPVVDKSVLPEVVVTEPVSLTAEPIDVKVTVSATAQVDAESVDSDLTVFEPSQYVTERPTSGSATQYCCGNPDCKYFGKAVALATEEGVQA